MKNYNILIVEDDFTSLQVIKKILEKENFSVIPVDNVDDAFSILEREKIDLIISDWMMPNIDGIEFLFRLKATTENPPPVIIVTALTSEMAKDYALQSGAADFIDKPINIERLVSSIYNILEKNNKEQLRDLPDFSPPFIPICFLSGNGGTKVLTDILHALNNLNENVVFAIIQQGNKFLIDSIAQQITMVLSKEVIIPEQNIIPRSRNVYIAPYDFHMFFNNKWELVLDKGPKENYQRPSAEPMFRSLANFFGEFTIVVVLSGLGSDGYQAAHQIKAKGGYIICQDPSTAIAPSLPKSFITQELAPIVTTPEEIPFAIQNLIEKIKIGANKKY
ncbi:MAG: chemotaxis protein CheB [Candidatus Kapaibacteriota bacterium]